MKVAALRATGLVPNVGKILLDDVYGWFERQNRGIYGLSENGRIALVTFAHVLEALGDEEAGIPLPSGERLGEGDFRRSNLADGSE